MILDHFKTLLKNKSQDTHHQGFAPYLHIDWLLLFCLFLLATAGLFILYSASAQSWHELRYQLFCLLIAASVMLVVAQIPPFTLQRAAPWLYLMGLMLLVAVLIIGHIGKGGQRWLNFGLMRFQPAELMKLAVPILLANLFHKIELPIKLRSVILALPIMVVPALLTAKQPDLSTAILIIAGGSSVLFLAGLSVPIMAFLASSLAICIPFAWYFLHDYQRNRVLTFLNPERDPLGKGYHIIQSKIALGSGGLFGKGWLNGTQSNLHFLPEHSTDFIFAVCGEEFGFIGGVILIFLYMLVIFRGIYISIHAQDTFSRLLAGSITFTYFISFFINIGMVTGILPVMGIPLPFVSHGGSSMMIMMASFGVLMSIQTHRKLVTT